jgi:hypothetical protein
LWTRVRPGLHFERLEHFYSGAVKSALRSPYPPLLKIRHRPDFPHAGNFRYSI